MCFFFIVRHCLQGDPGSPFLREPENAGGDAAEGDTCGSVLLCQFKAGAVAGGKLFFVLCSEISLHYGPHSMDHAFTGKIVGGSDLCLAGGFRVPLPGHDPGAGIPELDAGIGVYAVCDTLQNHTFLHLGRMRSL